VLIKKHRGGPVGEVALIFRKHLTKFENAFMRKTEFTE